MDGGRFLPDGDQIPFPPGSWCQLIRGGISAEKNLHVYNCGHIKNNSWIIEGKTSFYFDNYINICLSFMISCLPVFHDIDGCFACLSWWRPPKDLLWRHQQQQGSDQGIISGIWTKLKNEQKRRTPVPKWSNLLWYRTPPSSRSWEGQTCILHFHFHDYLVRVVRHVRQELVGNEMVGGGVDGQSGNWGLRKITNDSENVKY